MQKLLTIVVPVYKVEPYINKCLNSCILYKGDGTLDEEKMNQLEVIIVNDGTPDHSAELSREYTIRYPQTFRQIDKENGGHGSAWNVGLKEATGKYLRFLDSDDWLINLNLLLLELARVDADLVFTSYNKYYSATGEYKCQKINAAIGTMGGVDKDFLYAQDDGPLVMNFWHTTFKTSVLQQQFPLFAEKVMYDDYILCMAPLLYAKTYISFDFVVYNYLIGREGQSMSLKVQKRNIDSYMVCYHRLLDWRKDACLENVSVDLIECIDESIAHYARIIFGKLPFTSYQLARTQLPYYYQEGFVRCRKYPGTMVKRYQKLPFFLFYCNENIRRLIKNLMHK